MPMTYERTNLYANTITCCFVAKMSRVGHLENVGSPKKDTLTCIFWIQRRTHQHTVGGKSED